MRSKFGRGRGGRKEAGTEDVVGMGILHLRASRDGDQTGSGLEQDC